MKKKEIIIVVAMLFIGLFAYLILGKLYQGKMMVSVKNAKGEVLLSFNINEDNYYELSGDYGVFHVEVKDGRCRAINVECPNHDCEEVGWISSNNPLPIVCLPNNLVVRIDE